MFSAWMRFLVNPYVTIPICRKWFSGWGWITCAIEVDLMPAEAYAREKSAPGRVSTLMDYVCLKKTEKQVFIPEDCRDFFEMIYSDYPENPASETLH